MMFSKVLPVRMVKFVSGLELNTLYMSNIPVRRLPPLKSKPFSRRISTMATLSERLRSIVVQENANGARTGNTHALSRRPRPSALKADIRGDPDVPHCHVTSEEPGVPVRVLLPEARVEAVVLPDRSVAVGADIDRVSGERARGLPRGCAELIPPLIVETALNEEPARKTPIQRELNRIVVALESRERIRLDIDDIRYVVGNTHEVQRLPGERVQRARKNSITTRNTAAFEKRGLLRDVPLAAIAVETLVDVGDTERRVGHDLVLDREAYLVDELCVEIGVHRRTDRTERCAGGAALCAKHTELLSAVEETVLVLVQEVEALPSDVRRIVAAVHVGKIHEVSAVVSLEDGSSFAGDVESGAQARRERVPLHHVLPGRNPGGEELREERRGFGVEKIRPLAAEAEAEIQRQASVYRPRVLGEKVVMLVAAVGSDLTVLRMLKREI